MEERKYFYFLAVKEIAELWAEQEIGSGCEIDVAAVAAYINSAKFAVDHWGIKSKEEIYQSVTDDILAGYPIWHLLKLPEWTKQMVERSFAAEVKKEEERLKKTYKCYTCKWFKEQYTSFGVIQKCNWKPKPKGKHNLSWTSRRGEDFVVKKRCKNYERCEDKDN